MSWTDDQIRGLHSKADRLERKIELIAKKIDAIVEYIDDEELEDEIQDIDIEEV